MGYLFEEDFHSPALNLRWLKNKMGKPQLPYEHMVLTDTFGSIKDNIENVLLGRRLRRTETPITALMLGALLPYAALHPELFSDPNRAKAFALVTAYANFPGIHTLMISLDQRGIGKRLRESLEDGRLPAHAVYEPAGEGYGQMTAARIMEQLPKMTHGIVDNAGNIILLKHPLDGVAKAQTFKERAKNLRVWLKWNYPGHRTRFKLQKPRRFERATVPKETLLKRLLPQPARLKPAPAKGPALRANAAARRRN